MCVDPAKVCKLMLCLCVYKCISMYVCVCVAVREVSRSFCAPFECRHIDGGDVGD